MKQFKLDERTQKALDTISPGDKVKFYGCFEALVYKNDTFRIISEHPQIQETKHGKYVLVKLSNLGWFPIGKLKRIDETVFSDKDIQKGLICCSLDKDFRNCAECPYKDIPDCASKLTSDSNALIKRLDKFYAEKREARK